MSFFLAVTDESSRARIACSRRSESLGGVKKSEQEKTARDKVGVENDERKTLLSPAFPPWLRHSEV